MLSAEPGPEGNEGNVSASSVKRVVLPLLGSQAWQEQRWALLGALPVLRGACSTGSLSLGVDLEARPSYSEGSVGHDKALLQEFWGLRAAERFFSFLLPTGTTSLQFV